jgi:prepilin-type processing-associated H-X9-DG protein
VHPNINENLKFSNIVNPSPSTANFFIDEQSGPTTATCSIDDGYFAVDSHQSGTWRNPPASRHGNGGILSFADGHSELWRWVEPTTANLKGPYPAAFGSGRGGTADRDLMKLKRATYAEGSFK